MYQPPQYAGDVISWAAGGARYQSLVRPRHRLELAVGHAAHLGRAVLIFLKGVTFAPVSFKLVMARKVATILGQGKNWFKRYTAGCYI